MPPIDTSRLESLARHLLRLEEGADPTAASSAATDSAALAVGVADAPPPVARLAAALAAVTADIRDGNIARRDGTTT